MRDLSDFEKHKAARAGVPLEEKMRRDAERRQAEGATATAVAVADNPKAAAAIVTADVTPQLPSVAPSRHAETASADSSPTVTADSSTTATADDTDEAEADYLYVQLDTRLKHDGTLAKLKGAALSVYIAIGLHVNRNGEAWPSLDTLSKLTGYSKRQVQNAVKKLDGMMMAVTRGGIESDGKARANTYGQLRHFAYGKSTRRRR